MRARNQIVISLLIAISSVVVANAAFAATEPSLTLAERAFARGQFAEALTHWETMLKGELSSDERIDMLLRMAAANSRLGRVSEALSTLQTAKELAERHQKKTRQALVFGALSDAYLLSRRVEEAMDYAKASVEAAQQVSEIPVQAATFNYLGNVLMGQQSYAEALHAYQQGIALAQRSSSTALLIDLYINAVHAQLSTESTREALPLLKAAFKQNRDLRDSYDRALNLIAIGDLALRLARLVPNDGHTLSEIALEAFTEAYRLAAMMQHVRIKSYALGHLGELYAEAGRFDEAESLLRRALFFAHQTGAAELSARWYWQQARLLKNQDDAEAARVAYRKAIDHLQQIQPALVFGQRGNPRFFRDTVGRVYRELADVLLREAARQRSARQRQQLLHQVRDVMEAYKVVELKDFFRDDCVTEQQERSNITEIDSLLVSGTAVLYPIVFDQRTVLLLSLPDSGIKQVDVHVDAEQLKGIGLSFQQELTRSGNPRRLRAYGWQLYEWLIKPIEPDLEAQSITTLVVVPDDVLITIPYAALYDGQDFLVNRYAFVITPGLTLTDPSVFARAGHRVLLNGLSQSVQEFEPLPYVRNEIERIAKLFDSNELLDLAFNKGRLQEQLADTRYSTILFATHGRFLNNPQQSFLLTYEDRIRLAELDQFIRITQFRDQPIELLVLSACETAEGDERAALGLAGVAIKAGARSVMASLWAVNDASTAELVPAFFENLRDQTVSKARALQLAQLKLLADARYNHPFHWAPFVLIGNWL